MQLSTFHGCRFYLCRCAGKCIDYYGFTCDEMEEVQAGCPDAGNNLEIVSPDEN